MFSDHFYFLYQPPQISTIAKTETQISQIECNPKMTESDLTIEGLNERINGLTKLVEKQSALISKTGQQLIELQVKNVKTGINNMDKPSSNNSNSNIDLSDYVTNEDIVQLVGELQAQLDSLEDRSINRAMNSGCKQDDDKIASITNKDGETIDELFPKTVKQFKDLSKEALIQLAEFYELIVPDSANVEEFLNDNNSKTIEQAHNNFKSTVGAHMDKFSPEEIEEIKKQFARFIGLVNYV